MTHFLHNQMNNRTMETKVHQIKKKIVPTQIVPNLKKKE